MREETWILEQIGRGDDGAPVYRKSNHVLVHDGGSAVLEKVSDAPLEVRVRKIEYVDSITRVLESALKTGA